MSDHHFTEAQIEGILDLILEDDEDPDGCWTWLGRTDKDGYGRYGKELAHRAVWRILVGPIPEGEEGDHLCYNRLCVRPTPEPTDECAHVELTDHLENIRRRDEAARARERGER